MACLRDDLEEMKALTDLFLGADPKTVLDAAQAAQGLTRVEECANVRALAAPIHPPKDEERAKEVDAVRLNLAQIRALRDAGKLKEALSQATEEAHRAAKIGYRPLEAEALFLRGELEGKIADPKVAEATLYSAIAAAEAGHHDQLVARTWVKLVYHVGVRGARYAEAHRIDSLATGAIERVGMNDSLEALRLCALGLVLCGEGQFSSAVDAEERGLALMDRLHEGDDYDKALTLQYLGEALQGQGRRAEAIQRLEQAATMLSRLVGSEHPAIAGVLDDIGSLHREDGRYDDAIAFHKRSIAIAEYVGGAQSRDVFYATLSLAKDFTAQGNAADAAATFERALGIGERALGVDHPALILALSGLGEAKRALGDASGAVAPLERALDLCIAHPTTAAVLADARFALGRALWDGRPDREHRARARELVLTAKGRSDVDAWLAAHPR
jgi:tetratricopeptide (TPR) repeat protein